MCSRNRSLCTSAFEVENILQRGYYDCYGYARGLTSKLVTGLGMPRRLLAGESCRALHVGAGSSIRASQGNLIVTKELGKLGKLGDSAFSKMCRQPGGRFMSGIAPLCTDHVISVENSPTKDGKARQKAWREGQVQLVEKICNLLIRNNWSVDTINELEKLKIRVSPKLVNKVIRQVNDADLAYHFFYWAGRRPLYNHNTYTYHAIIEVMGAAQKFDVQLQLLQEMHHGGIQLNASTFNIIMLAYTRARYTEGVVNIFNQMKVYGCNPNAFSFKCAVRSLVWSGRVAEALSMYKAMVDFGYVADNFTYNGLIEGLSKAGNVNEAQLIFQEMEDRGMTPDAIAHAALIKGLDMEGRVEEACRLFQDMTGKNLGTVVDTHKGVMGVFSKKRRKHDLSSSESKKATA